MTTSTATVSEAFIVDGGNKVTGCMRAARMEIIKLQAA